MGSYLISWRRKFGIATLTLACLFAAVWVRSFLEDTSLPFGLYQPFGGGFYGISIQQQSIDLIEMEMQMTQAPGQNGVQLIPAMIEPEVFEIEGDGPELNDLSPILPVGAAMGITFDEHVMASIPLWSIVIPLTLLSAYLLLGKPRTKPPVLQPEKI